MLHPIRRLPAEVLEQIFTEFVEEDRKQLRNDFEEYFHTMKETLHFAPFIISSVCRRWRQTAIETLRLWSYLRVPTCQITSSPWLPGTFCVLWLGKGLYELSLKRSKGADLEIALCPSKHSQSAILKTYLATIPPSQSVVLNVHRFRIIPALPCSPRIMRVIPPKDIPGAQLTLGYTAIHTQSILSLNCYNTIPSSGNHSVGRTIKILHLLLSKRTAWPDLMSVFIDFPNLSKLDFAGLAPKCPPISSIRPLVYNALVHLVLYEDFASTIEYLLKCGIAFPALKQLVIHGTSQLKGSHYDGMGDVLDIVQDVTIKPSPWQAPLISSDIDARTALDLMHNVQALRICDQIVETLIGALNIEPPKVINHLVIEDWVGKGDGVREYLEKRKAQANDSAIGPKISFINCPNIPTDLQEGAVNRTVGE